MAFFAIISIFLFSFSFVNCVIYPLCDDQETYCVEVDPSYPCTNCDGTTLQSVHDALIEDSATIYLVGEPGGARTDLEECVTLSYVTPEDISKVNSIKPYPGHSIRMLNPSDCSVLQIQSIWWKISGEGGNLEMESQDPFTQSRFIYITGGGIFFEYVTIRLNHYKSLIELDGTNLYGYYFGNNYFAETASPTSYTIYQRDDCIGCSNSSFTDEYGLERRVWYKDNIFAAKPQSYHIGYGTLNTAEGNYFLNRCPFRVKINGVGYRIFNNVIHFKTTGSQYVLFNWYFIQATVYSPDLFYNNLIVDEVGVLRSITHIIPASLSYCDDLTHKIYMYNNIIDAPTRCISFFGCPSTCLSNSPFIPQRASLLIGYNHQTRTGCSAESWYDMGDGYCDIGSSVIDILGNNTEGAVTFSGSGNYPYPQFSLSKIPELAGMGVDDVISPLILPYFDYNNKARHVGGYVTKGTEELKWVVWQCFGFDDDVHNVCSGNGVCVSQDNCVCDNHYFGEDCSVFSYFAHLSGNKTGGDDFPSVWDGYCDTTEAKPSPRSHTQAFSFPNNDIYVFGGIGYYDILYNEVWRIHYEGGFTTPTWCHISGTNSSYDGNATQSEYSTILEYSSNNMIGTRYAYSSFTADFSFLVFGGERENPENRNVTNELWEFSVVSRSNRYQWRILFEHDDNPIGQTQPTPRSFGCASIHKDREKVFMFGGKPSNSSLLLNDFWEYNVQTNIFTRLRDGDNTTFNGDYEQYTKNNFEDPLLQPPQRMEHMCWMDDDFHFFVFGGTLENGRSVNDVWMYNQTLSNWGIINGGENNTENRISTLYEYDAMNLPSVRSGMIHFTQMNRYFGSFEAFYGGRDIFSGLYFGDMWIFSNSLNQFKFLNGTAESNNEGMVLGMIGSRAHGVGICRTNREFIIFGGRGIAEV